MLGTVNIKLHFLPFIQIYRTQLNEFLKNTMPYVGDRNQAITTAPKVRTGNTVSANTYEG